MRKPVENFTRRIGALEQRLAALPESDRRTSAAESLELARNGRDPARMCRAAERDIRQAELDAGAPPETEDERYAAAMGKAADGVDTKW